MDPYTDMCVPMLVLHMFYLFFLSWCLQKGNNLEGGRNKNKTMLKIFYLFIIGAFTLILLFCAEKTNLLHVR